MNIDKLADAAANYGFFAVLFVFLFYYVLKETKKREEESLKREKKYQEVLNGLTDILQQNVKDIKCDTVNIHSCVKTLESQVQHLKYALKDLENKINLLKKEGN